MFFFRIQPLSFIFASLFLFGLLPKGIQAQENNSQILKLLASCEKYYGTNDELVNGSIYQQPDHRITGHPYLFSNEWQGGTFFIQNNTYEGLPVKYDLVQEALVLNIAKENTNNFQINVNSSLIDSVRIGNLLFINSNLFLPDSVKTAFYEKIYRGSFFVGRRYEKRFIDLYNTSNPQGRFSDLRINLYIINNGTLADITKEKSFLEMFAVEERKKIKSFIKQKVINYKKASLEQYTELFNYVSQIVKQ